MDDRNLFLFNAFNLNMFFFFSNNKSKSIFNFSKTKDNLIGIGDVEDYFFVTANGRFYPYLMINGSANAWAVSEE